MQTHVTFSNETEHVNVAVQRNEAHSLIVTADAIGNYVLVEANSREALFEFGRSLMEHALFGQGDLEFYPLAVEGKNLVVNGVRLPENSARVFVSIKSNV